NRVQPYRCNKKRAGILVFICSFPETCIKIRPGKSTTAYHIGASAPIVQWVRG
ncbi:hypothetical protein L914_18745, partial [Phytophthora nicotianae]